jgi:hypothetical protein
MTRARIRLALPSVMLALAIGCSPKPEAPPASSTEQAPADGTATEAPVTPAPGADTPEPAVPGSSAPASAAAPVPQAPARQGARAGAARPPAPAPAVETPPQAPAPIREVAPEPPAPPPVRMVTVPADTPLRLTLLSDVASDTSAVEDRVSARVAADVAVDGETVIPAGAQVAGVVTYAQPSAKVKGRAAITVRFRTLTIGSRTYDIASEPLRREARGTKAKDAGKIGIGAGAGAVVGGIIGGRKGAGIGAVVGGAGGTGVVLATKGEEVRLPSGTSISTRLESPLVVEMRPER